MYTPTVPLACTPLCVHSRTTTWSVPRQTGPVHVRPVFVPIFFWARHLDNAKQSDNSALNYILLFQTILAFNDVHEKTLAGRVEQKKFFKLCCDLIQKWRETTMMTSLAHVRTFRPLMAHALILPYWQWRWSISDMCVPHITGDAGAHYVTGCACGPSSGSIQ